MHRMLSFRVVPGTPNLNDVMIGFRKIDAWAEKNRMRKLLSKLDMLFRRNPLFLTIILFFIAMVAAAALAVIRFGPKSSGSSLATQLNQQSIVVTGGDHRCDCETEHFAPVRITGGNYIHSCVPISPAPSYTHTNTVTRVVITGGDYICPCERTHGAPVEVIGGADICDD